VRRQTACEKNERDDDEPDERSDEEAEGQRQAVFVSTKVLHETGEALVPPRLVGSR
jgi:hypothetical protein